MKRLARLLLALAVAGCGTAAGADTNESQGPPPNEENRSVAVGSTVAFLMHVHCGVESTAFNGRVWNAETPLYATPERLGPPAGWDNPYQDGELTLESRDRAVFAAQGQRIVLRPSRTGEALRPCD